MCRSPETPNSTKLKNMPSWEHISKRRYANVYRTDSCRFGSPHLKPFKFLTVNLRMRRAIKRSTCTKPHLKVQGSLTKQSATYVDALASGIAEDFSEAILARKRRLRDDDLPVDGLENQLINEVMLSSEWTVKRDWKFAKEGHISTFWRSELIHRLIRDLLGLGPSYRVVALVDSYVTRGAVSKGRSSSKTISALLRDARCGADPGWHLPCHSNYLPTRYNCSDDPTRCRSLRSSLVCMVLCNFAEEDLYKLGLLKGTRRWASNWVRPCLGLVG